MAELLEKSNSSYFPSFKSMFRDVVSGELIIMVECRGKLRVQESHLLISQPNYNVVLTACLNSFCDTLELQ